MPAILRRVIVVTLCVLSCSSSAQAAGLLMPSGSGPLALKHHRVEIHVRNGVTVTTVDQVFVNDGPRQLEATYLFPLPGDAVLSDFKLQVNGVMKRGEVLEKAEAERIYMNIVRSMRDPGLVDWMGQNLFRARIFPVPARGTQRISITYTEVTPRVNDTYRVRHPLRIPEAASQVLEDFTTTVHLNHNVPIRAIYSPSHRISVSRRGDFAATVGFEESRVSLDRDFVLHFGVSDEDVGINVLPHRKDGEPGYFTLLASPRHAFEKGELPRKAITFVLDTSGSMRGKKLDNATGALAACLERLGASDHFNIIRFASDVETFRPRLVPATQGLRDAAKAFVGEFEAAGGTAIDAALDAALRSPSQEKNLPHIVLFITDGRPTVGQTARAKILERAEKANRHGARVFVLGVGDDIETTLLDGLAEAHGGATSYVRGDARLSDMIGGLYGKLAHPVLTDLAIEISHVRTYGVNPVRLPTLFKGDQLVITGRYRSDGDALIRLSGSMNGARRTWDYEASFPDHEDDNAFVAPLWANRQVGLLLDQVRTHGETPGLKAEIVQLARRFGIVTPYTSYLVTEGRHGQPARPTIGRPGRKRTLGDSMSALDGDLRDEAESAVHEAFGTGGRGLSGRGIGGGGRVDGAAPEASPKPAFDSKRGGGHAVKEAKVLRHMKYKKQAASDVAFVRYVGGRVMRLKSGRWEDGEPRSKKGVVRIAPYSSAWLEIRRLHPWLAPILALGERVMVSVKGVDLIVEPGASKTLSRTDRRSLR